MALANGASPATSAVTEGGAQKIIGYGNPESCKSSKTQNQASPIEAFTLRAEVSRDRVRIEVEDGGGPWRDGLCDDGRPHGFDVVTAIAGAGNWGVDGDSRGRIAWARLGW